MRHESGTFEVAKGIQLAWQSWTPSAGARAVLVLVHGYGEHSGRYRTYVEHLVPLGYAVYGFDLRGHGRSPGPRGHIMSWNEFRSDVRCYLEFVREREPERPLFLLGHSMGGLIVLDFALDHHEDLAGVIVSAPALAQTSASPAYFMVGRVLSRLMPAFSIERRNDASRLSRDPHVATAFVEDPLNHTRGSARFSTEFSRTMLRTQARANEWHLPLLVLHGNADRTVPYAASRAFFEQVPVEDKTYITYEGGYHEPHNDIDSSRVVRDVEAWLERHVNAT